MRMVFGVLGSLVVLVIMGLLVTQQLRVVRGPVPAQSASGAGAAATSGTPQQPSQPSQPLQNKVRDDLNNIMRQAPARLEPAQ